MVFKKDNLILRGFKMKKYTCSVSCVLFIMMLACTATKNIHEQIIKLPVHNLNASVDELSYVMGVGDLNSDGETDFVIRLWSEENDLKNDIET